LRASIYNGSATELAAQQDAAECEAQNFISDQRERCLGANFLVKRDACSLPKPPRYQKGGFTLLEVLIAVALLGVAMLVVVQSQAINAVQTRIARDLSVSALLAREKMGEVEIEIRKKQSFDDLDEDCGHGDFDDQGYRYIKWECKNEPLKLDMDSSQLLASLEAIASGEAEGGLLQRP
jgi:prepilin-type N-terminal cleavage/methylation domain-containing protein